MPQNLHKLKIRIHGAWLLVNIQTFNVWNEIIVFTYVNSPIELTMHHIIEHSCFVYGKPRVQFSAQRPVTLTEVS